MIPEDNHAAGSYVLDPKGVEFLIVYAVGFALFVSLVFNCQLANRVLKLRRERTGAAGSTGPGAPGQQRPVPPSPAFRTPTRGAAAAAPSSTTTTSGYLQEAAGDRSNSLEEPLLTAASSDDADRESQPPSGTEEFKEEAE